MEVVIRNAVMTDRSFVLSSWLKSYRKARYFDGWDNKRYYSDENGYQHRIKQILNRVETRLVVAHFEEDPDEILGWAAGEPPDGLHYVYVKQPFRNSGTPNGEEDLNLADRLISAICPRFGIVGTICSSTCNNWPMLRDSYKLIFNPYL